MPAFGPISRQNLIKNLRKLGFAGPFTGTRHEYMELGDVTPRIPNPHKGDISRDLLGRVLEQAGVSKEEWHNLYLHPDLAVSRRRAGGGIRWGFRSVG